MKATNGTIKLAIEFDGWKQEGHSFMHPFGRFGLEAGPVAFHHLWNRLRRTATPERSTSTPWARSLRAPAA